jgi:hypothetical protein
MLCKILAAHPSLRPMIVAQVAEFTATMWLQHEMDIHDSKLGGSLDKVSAPRLCISGSATLTFSSLALQMCLLLKKWDETELDGRDIKGPEMWISFVESLALIFALCSPSSSIR